MTPTPSRPALAAMIFALAALAGCSAEAPAAPERIGSTLGYSFLPPPGEGWTKQMAPAQVTFNKETDTARVTFFAGVVEGHTRTRMDTAESLLAFVRGKKGDYGTEGRYTDAVTQVDLEPAQPSCVSYRSEARDHGAKNVGDHDALVMLTRGRFCLHPDDRTAAVDLYYSIRHAPGFDPAAMIAEGDAYLQGLEFDRQR